MCGRERERACVCVCVWQRKRERERERVCVGGVGVGVVVVVCFLERWGVCLGEWEEWTMKNTRSPRGLNVLGT